MNATKTQTIDFSELSQVEAFVAEHKNERGIKHWKQMKNPQNLKSFGIGLTQLRKLAKQIGRNRALSQVCWQSDFYDVRVISLLIDEPKAITLEQAESQVEQLNAGMLTHIFSSCDATLAKSPLALELAIKWRDADDDMRKKSAYGLIYELSKNKRDKRLTDDFFLAQVQLIDQRIDQERKGVRLAMASALMGVGKRNQPLNQACVAVAKRVGPIDFNEEGAQYDPFDVLKHLQSPALMAKFSQV